MQTWATAFAGYTNGAVQTNYQAVGSGSGITGVLTGLYEFAGSDAPVSASQLSDYTANGPFLQIPETLGGVAIFYNVPGVTVSLNFTGPVLAKIYLGTITMWNDPAIATLNPGCHTGSTTCVLPADTIIPVHRSDGSGTTYALSNYLSKVSADWNSSYATYQGSACSAATPCYGTNLGTFWNANPNAQGAAKSSGVAAYVEGNSYSLGYADSFYAFNNGLQAASIENQAGVFLAPSLSSIAAAANAFSAQVLANPTFTITNAPGAGSYPISTFTYLLVWANQKNQQQGYDTAQFFEWIVNQGQSQIYGPNLGYPALPTSVVAIDQKIIHQMNYNGVSFTPT
jgi:phosphate transport system substrate-binding protein